MDWPNPLCSRRRDWISAWFHQSPRRVLFYVSMQHIAGHIVTATLFDRVDEKSCAYTFDNNKKKHDRHRLKKKKNDQFLHGKRHG